MIHFFTKKTDIRRVILILTIASAMISLVNTFYAGYKVQRQQLIENTLENNYAYATKLAKSTDDYLKSAQQQLNISAGFISKNFSSLTRIEEEVERLRMQTDSFNSIIIFDHNARVLATSPNTLQLVGKILETSPILESIKTRKSIISSPYVSTIGNLLISIIEPIFTPEGHYIGAVAGTIYLQKQGILHRLLGEHYHKDGSYIYVIDKEKNIIYHPEKNRVGKKSRNHEIYKNIFNQVSGSSIITNSSGIEMLAGYAIVPTTGWGIIAQRPLSATLAPLEGLMYKVLFNALPIAILSILGILWCTSMISRPLRLLAEGAQSMADPDINEKIQSVRSWYFESYELKKAILLGINLFQQSLKKLREDAQTDPLTGLGNRRHLEIEINNLYIQKIPFSIISIDIDFFKKVNDTYGHDVGDIVLKQISESVKNISRTNDILCRLGGEEFLVLLPQTSKKLATQIAERLRNNIENTQLPSVGKVTISLGVSSWPEDSNEIVTVIKQADEMLYRAKHNGRNRVEVYEDSTV